MINTETNKIPFPLFIRSKAFAGTAVTVALLTFLNYTTPLFSFSGPLHSYFWTLPTAAMIGTSLSIFVPIFRKTFEQPQKIKEPFNGNIQDSSNYLSENQSTTEIKLLIEKILDPEKINLNTWFLGITKKSKDERDETKRALITEQKNIQEELKNKPSQDLYKKEIFITILLQILTKEIPFRKNDQPSDWFFVSDISRSGQILGDLHQPLRSQLKDPLPISINRPKPIPQHQWTTPNDSKRVLQKESPLERLHEFVSSLRFPRLSFPKKRRHQDHVLPLLTLNKEYTEAFRSISKILDKAISDSFKATSESFWH